MLISGLVNWDVRLLVVGAIAATWGVQKFYAFWRDEDIALPVPAVLLRVVLPLGAISIIAAAADAWLLGGLFMAVHVIVQAYYSFVMRPKQDREQGRELPPWWR
jgi:hypothetical protein